MTLYKSLAKCVHIEIKFLKLYVENVYKEMNFLRKKSMHTKSVFQDKMLRQNYTFKNYIIHKECDYRATIVRIKVHNEIFSI